MLIKDNQYLNDYDDYKYYNLIIILNNYDIIEFYLLYY